MTRPDNPFAAHGVGVLYAQGRPYHHPRALARALAMLGESRVDRALDVACGTALSTVALSEIADVVVGADQSPEMLAVVPRAERIAYVRSAAERLPFPDRSFDAITVSSGVHWFDQVRFYEETRRLLRPGGWLALYDHYFLGEMIGVPEFSEWTRVAFDRYPLPERNPQVGDPRADMPPGFTKIGDEFYADDIDMTQDQFIAYELSLSPFVAAAERGRTRDELTEWLRETTAAFFAGVPTRAVRFLGSLTCLRPNA
ncbi:MAG: class I SAM-dependent methyltransferase [Actinomycetota bacterium]